MSELHVLFRVGDANYVLPAAQVVEMESFTRATAVPGAAHYVAGLVQIRGRVIPVIDLRARFGLPPIDRTLDARVIVIRNADREVGLLADSAREVLRIETDAFRPPPEVVVEQSEGFVDQVAQATKGAPFASLATADQDAVVDMLAGGAFEPDLRRDGDTFFQIVTRHTIEGAFSAPEYGGNAFGQGWSMIGLEGDSQPLGFSIFSTATGGYVERPDHPMSTANPDEIGPGGAVVPKPISADGKAVQDFIVLATSIFGE